jgi:hypothetical protein
MFTGFLVTGIVLLVIWASSVVLVGANPSWVSPLAQPGLAFIGLVALIFGAPILAKLVCIVTFSLICVVGVVISGALYMTANERAAEEGIERRRLEECRRR